MTDFTATAEIRITALLLAIQNYRAGQSLRTDDKVIVDYVVQQLTALHKQAVAEAVRVARVDEVNNALTDSNNRDIAGQHKWYLEDRFKELNRSRPTEEGEAKEVPNA